MLSMFVGFAVEIDKRDEVRECIVKISRDVTRHSKKIGFLLHRCPLSDPTTSQYVQILHEADQKLKDIHHLLRYIASNMSSQQQYDRFNRAFAPGIQELVEAEAFLKFLQDGTLLSKTELDRRIQDALQEQQHNFDFYVSPEDYVLGILDMTGELMRRAISCASSGRLDSVMMIRDFMLEMHQHLSTLNLKTKDFETKMNTLLACIDKVETACYKRFIRKQEFPDELQIPETLLEGKLADGDSYNLDQFVQGSTWN